MQEKCPSKKAPSEFNRGLNNRSAIYTPFAQAIPNVPVIDREHCIKFKTGKCGVCSKVCQAGAIDYDQKDEIVTEKYGAIVVATGLISSNWTTTMSMHTARAKMSSPLWNWNVS